jgi:hypothetical protein
MVRPAIAADYTLRCDFDERTTAIDGSVWHMCGRIGTTRSFASSERKPALRGGWDHRSARVLLLTPREVVRSA